MCGWCVESLAKLLSLRIVTFSSSFTFSNSHIVSLHLTIPYTLFMNTFGLQLIIFHFIHFSIKREFMIKYLKIDVFSFISQSWMSFVMSKNIWRLQQKDYSRFSNIFSNLWRFEDNYSIIFKGESSWGYG